MTTRLNYDKGGVDLEFIPLHITFVANESQQTIPQTLSVKSDRPRRMKLRSANIWEQRRQSQSDFRVRDIETIIGSS